MAGRYALIIGLSQYQSLAPLPNVLKDAEAMATSLESLGDGAWTVERYPCKHVAENQYVLKEARVSCKQLVKRLETFLFETAKGSDALVYFAGHGLRVAGLSTFVTPKGYLAVWDSDGEGRNAIALSDLNQLFAQARSTANLSSLVVLLDCCHAGMAFEGTFERHCLIGNLPVFQQTAKFGLLAACRGHKAAYEQNGHGVFTGAVLVALTQARGGRVTFADLMASVRLDLNGSGQEPVDLSSDASGIEIIRGCQALEESPGRSSPGKVTHRFLNLLRQFNYRKADRVFQEFLDEAACRVGAFWIRGQRDGGQKWLLHRLWVEQVPGSTDAVKKTLKIRAGSRLEELWQQLGAWRGVKATPDAIANDLLRDWQNGKTVALVLYEVERLKPADLDQLLADFWQPLVAQIQACDRDNPFLLFLVDLGRRGDNPCPIDCIANYDNDAPARLVELATDSFKARDFRWWSDWQTDLQAYLNGESIESAKQQTIALNQDDETTPEDVLEEICYYGGVNWHRDVAPQFLAG